MADNYSQRARLRTRIMISTLPQSTLLILRFMSTMTNLSLALFSPYLHFDICVYAPAVQPFSNTTVGSVMF